MRDRHPQGLALKTVPEEGRCFGLHPQPGRLTAELQAGVAQQGAREHARLAQDLETVADPQDQSACQGMLAYRLHQRREPGDRATAQVVAVGEATWQNDDVGPLQVAIGVPEPHRLPARQIRRMGAVTIAPGAREDGDPEANAHGVTASRNSNLYSSITPLQSRRRHISSTLARAVSASSPVSSRLMNFPTRVAPTSG